MTTKATAAVLVGIFLTLGFACGNAKHDARATRAERAIRVAAQQRAEAAVLELADLPRGWQARPARDDPAARDVLRQCLGIDYSSLTITGEAGSDSLARAPTEASSRTTVYADEREARDAFRQLSDGMAGGAAERCFRDLVEQANMVEVREVQVDTLSPTELTGIDEEAAWEMTISVALGGSDESSTAAYLELHALRRDDLVATLQTTDAAGPLRPELRGRLIRALARRIREE